MDLIDAGNKLRRAWSETIKPQTPIGNQNSQQEPAINGAKRKDGNSIRALIGSKDYIAGYG